MTADEIRSLEMWTQHFEEIMLREIAAQLVEIHELVQEGVAMLGQSQHAKPDLAALLNAAKNAAKSKGTRPKGK